MKIHCFTHWDVDGLVSYLVLRWFLKIPITYTTTQAKKFKTDWEAWVRNNDIESYDRVYILDLDIAEHVDIIDYNNVFVIDHHRSNNLECKNCTGAIKEYSSAAKLCYKLFSKMSPDVEITDAQKKLIILADDYDSYTLQIPESMKLNIVFWNTNKAFETLQKQLIMGFHGFTHQQENIIKLHYDKLKKIESSLNVYTGKINIQGQIRYVCATFSDTMTNDIADILKDKYNADISIIVNPKINHVSFRRPKHIKNLDVSILAKTLTDGGGHEYAAGGSITDKFMQFTKLLKQIK